LSIKNKLGAKADTPKNFKWISSGSTLSASSSWWAKDFFSMLLNYKID